MDNLAEFWLAENRVIYSWAKLSSGSGFIWAVQPEIFWSQNLITDCAVYLEWHFHINDSGRTICNLGVILKWP